jgi:hypothetical protein
LEKNTVTAVAVGFPRDQWGRLQRNSFGVIKVRHAVSPDDIAERLAGENPHMVIAYHNREIGGLETLRKDILSKAPGAIAVLAVPFPDTSGWLDALEAGFQDVIAAPFHQEDIRHLASSVTEVNYRQFALTAAR